MVGLCKFWENEEWRFFYEEPANQAITLAGDFTTAAVCEEADEQLFTALKYNPINPFRRILTVYHLSMQTPYLIRSRVNDNELPPKTAVDLLVSAIFTVQCTLMQSAVMRSHVVRQSVRPSVTLVDCDHIGWKSWKLIAQTISPTSSLFVVKRRPTYCEGNMGTFGETRGGVGKKVAFCRTKAVISLKRAKIEEKLIWTAYIETHKLSFERYHPRPPTASHCVGIARDRPNFWVPPINSGTVATDF